jgi:hypothetical protein
MGRQREAGTGYFDQVAHAIAPDTETAAPPVPPRALSEPEAVALSAPRIW